MKTKTFYTCGIGWQEDPDIKLYDSIELLKEKTDCWHECGIVKVEVVEKEWMEEQDLDYCDKDNQLSSQDDECNDVRHHCGKCGCNPCQCDENNEMLRLQGEMKKIYNLSGYAWEQVSRKPEEAKNLFKWIHSIASGGEYMFEPPENSFDE